ncbi:MAG: hypothetical protein ACOVMP_00475 [Chthoniobacterales bacterium]
MKTFGIKPTARAGTVRLYDPAAVTAALEAERICQIGALQNARFKMFSTVERFSRLANSLGIACGKINATEARELAQAVASIGAIPTGEKRTRNALVNWNARWNGKHETAFALMNKIASNL